MNALIDDCISFFAGCSFNYAICGGYALELFSNNRIRPHSDIDVWISDEDRERSLRYVLDQGWEIYEPIGDHLLRQIADPRRQRVESLCVFGIKPGCSFIDLEKTDDGSYEMHITNNEQLLFDFIELIFNPEKDGYFLFSQNQIIRRDMSRARLLSPEKIAYMAPEVVLFCKSGYIAREGYQEDFDVTVPLLSQEQAEWLLDSLKTAYPDGHTWIGPLLKK